jgi:hypothetical protein
MNHTGFFSLAGKSGYSPRALGAEAAACVGDVDVQQPLPWRSAGCSRPSTSAMPPCCQYATQVEVFQCLRHGGQQVVHVEHVHVNDGGQAVIGNLKEADTPQ